MSTPTWLDCFGEDEVVCPHCGFKHSDSYEYISENKNTDCTEIECSECDQKFEIEWDFSVTFTSRPIGGWPVEVSEVSR